jgi:hypothetical protein
MRKFILLATSVLALGAAGCPAVAVAFGPHGHEVVGAVADRLLRPPAKARVQALLGMPLRLASTWADCVKDVMPVAGQGLRYQPDARYGDACRRFDTPAGRARMQDFVARNWSQCAAHAHDQMPAQACHKTYHYADVAIQHDHYDRAFAGTSDHDVVSVLAAAIAVLQGRPAIAPVDIADQTEALLLLAHLVGDVHQPLHVGSVYLDNEGRQVDPGPSGQPVDRQIDTRGGNAIEDDGTNLHAQWDVIPASLDAQALPAAMLKAARAVPATPGPLAQWPARWASASVIAAREAYGGLTFTRSGAVRPGNWVVVVTDRPAHEARRAALQERQLTLAGARLAQLLNACWP